MGNKYENIKKIFKINLTISLNLINIYQNDDAIIYCFFINIIRVNEHESFCIRIYTFEISISILGFDKFE